MDTKSWASRVLRRTNRNFRASPRPYIYTFQNPEHGNKAVIGTWGTALHCSTYLPILPLFRTLFRVPRLFRVFGTKSLILINQQLKINKTASETMFQLKWKNLRYATLTRQHGTGFKGVAKCDPISLLFNLTYNFFYTGICHPDIVCPLSTICRLASFHYRFHRVENVLLNATLCTMPSFFWKGQSD